MTPKEEAEMGRDLKRIELDHIYNWKMEFLNHIKHEIEIKFQDLDDEITRKYEQDFINVGRKYDPNDPDHERDIKE